MRIGFSSRPFVEDAPNPMLSLLGKCLAARRMIRKGSMIALGLSGTDVGAAELGTFFEGPQLLLKPAQVYSLANSAQFSSARALIYGHPG